MRHDAIKSEILEEFLHNTQFNLKMQEKVSLQALEVHVKDFMIRHAEMLGINNKYDIELLQRYMIMEVNKLPRNNL